MNPSNANTQIVLAKRPAGAPQAHDFKLLTSEIPTIGDNQILVRSHYLSLDPYMRGRMNDAKSYANPVALGEVMVGGAVGEVLDSRHPDLQPGDAVLGEFGWQTHCVADGGAVQKIKNRQVPLSAYLGVLGMPGVTAYVGLLDIGKPKKNETVVVTAASGAVGSVVGQIAKIHGCRAVGIAGGPQKCQYVVDELGFDACIDYKADHLYEDLKASTPRGIDVSFENVGGPIFDTLLSRINPFGRVALCGLISQYNATQPYGMRGIGNLLINRVMLRGFIVSDFLERWPAALKDLSQWVSEGRIKYRESVVDGIENAPAAFLGLLEGKNFGKQLVKLI